MADKEAPKEITVQIDDKTLHAKPGQMIIQVADDHGIYIPRFCYHKKLSIAANCRMCLVDIENARKPSPACATPVMDGMKVYTKNKKTLAYQKTIMEFLLINHPLDCPICDQGGECELQDIALGYGRDVSKFSEGKRVVKDPDLGPLVATDLTRCIQCTRCVRFGEEIAGLPEMGATGRGEHMTIGTYVAKSVDSELSGNMIDVCPVGALTSKPFRFRARAWELNQKATIAPHDSLGSNQYLHTRRGEIFRAVPKENDQINETWLSDRDRFGYEGITSNERLTHPMIKKRDEWERVSWEEALDFIKTALESVKKVSSDKIAAIAHPSSTLEELYLLQKLMRSLGSNSIDTRLRQGALSNGLSTGCGIDCSFDEIEEADYILLVGSNLRKEVPLLNHRLKKAAKQGAKVAVVNPRFYDFNFPLQEVITEADELVHMLASILKSVLKLVKAPLSFQTELETLLSNTKANADSDRIARNLMQAENAMIFLGQIAVMDPHFDIFYSLYQALKVAVNAKGGVIGFGANQKGADLVNARPVSDQDNHAAYHLGDVLSGAAEIKACILLNTEPELDTLLGQKALSTLEKMDYVISLSSYMNDTISSYADVVLPIATYAETDGSLVNLMGQKQSFKACVLPKDEVKPAWKVLRVLANFLNLDGFEYQSTSDVIAEIDASTIDMNKRYSNDVRLPSALPRIDDGIRRIMSVSLYSVDPIIRRASALQQTKDRMTYDTIKLSSALAMHYQVSDGDNIRVIQGLSEAVLEVDIDPLLKPRSVEIASGIEKTTSLWDYTKTMTLEKVE
ncbi:NADH-quinone oxidoreductase subunit G [bacterium SCSIO 12844]|nr:NADH-quinone oxidoreductase subunit G [bacterium SCSIO 12844]